MKEIMAVIRMNMINQTKEALLAEGFSSLYCKRVTGRGRKKVDYAIVEKLVTDGVETISPIMAEVISESHRLVPKRLVSMIVKSEDAKKVLDIIIRTNSMGKPGDGKIFVMPILDSIRVRTGESGEVAL